MEYCANSAESGTTHITLSGTKNSGWFCRCKCIYFFFLCLMDSPFNSILFAFATNLSMMASPFTADISYPPCLSIRVCASRNRTKSTEGFRRIDVGVLRRPSVDLYSNNPFPYVLVRLPLLNGFGFCHGDDNIERIDGNRLLVSISV